MKRWLPAVLAFLVLLPCWGAERVFDLTQHPVHGLPKGFHSALTGFGHPGDWQIIQATVPSPFKALTPNASSNYQQPVIAQLAQEPLDEHFPLLILGDQTYGDFTFSLRFETVKGVMEQMAGVVFRYQNTSNYYVVRASSLGSTFRFYPVVNGHRGNLIGPNLKIPAGVWHSLSVQCLGNRIRIKLDGKQVIPDLTDDTFRAGKIGLWTKSDSVSYFTDLRLKYTPQVTLAQQLVQQTFKRYPRLLDMAIYSTTSKQPKLHVVASHDPKDLGKLGGHVEKDCIARGQVYAGKVDHRYLVTMPLRDRNGDPIAAIRFVLRSVPGEIDVHAVGRVQPIMRMLQPQVLSLRGLTE